MTDIDILNTSWKTQVTPEQSAEIQRLLFKFGKRWGDDSKEISNTDSNLLFYYFYSGFFRHSKNCKDHYERHSNIELKADDIIAALRKLEGDKPVTEETNEDGWVSIEESLPGINKEIETKYIDKGGNEYFGRGKLSLNLHDYINFNNIGAMFRSDAQLKYWRYPKQKHPDFGKLREGDILVIDHIHQGKEELGTMIFIKIDNGNMYGKPSSDFDFKVNNKFWFEIKSITKITRINLQTKELEEI